MAVQFPAIFDRWLTEPLQGMESPTPNLPPSYCLLCLLEFHLLIAFRLLFSCFYSSYSEYANIIPDQQRRCPQCTRSFAFLCLVSGPILRPTVLLVFPWRSQIGRSHHIVGGCERVLHEIHVRLILSTRSCSTDVDMVIHLQLLVMIC